MEDNVQHLKIDMVFQLTTFDVSIDGMAKGFYGAFCVPTQQLCVSPMHVSCLSLFFSK
jgi:hypothetical protein